MTEILREKVSQERALSAVHKLVDGIYAAEDILKISWDCTPRKFVQLNRKAKKRIVGLLGGECLWGLVKLDGVLNVSLDAVDDWERKLDQELRTKVGISTEIHIERFGQKILNKIAPREMFYYLPVGDEQVRIRSGQAISRAVLQAAKKCSPQISNFYSQKFSTLGDLWVKKQMLVKISTLPEDFLSLGDTAIDDSSCFGFEGERVQDKFMLAHDDHSVIVRVFDVPSEITLSRDIRDKLGTYPPYTRAWGFLSGRPKALLITNNYGGSAATTQMALQPVLQHLWKAEPVCHTVRYDQQGYDQVFYNAASQKLFHLGNTDATPLGRSLITKANAAMQAALEKRLRGVCHFCDAYIISSKDLHTCTRCERKACRRCVEGGEAYRCYCGGKFE